MTPEDHELFDRSVSELRELGAEALAHSATLLTSHAADVAQRGRPNEGKALLLAARLLYVLANESPGESLG
jgi:hypothetical protein